MWHSQRRGRARVLQLPTTQTSLATFGSMPESTETSMRKINRMPGSPFVQHCGTDALEAMLQSLVAASFFSLLPLPLPLLLEDGVCAPRTIACLTSSVGTVVAMP